MNKKYLSVVLPAYNEEYNLRTGVLDSVYDYLKNQKYTWEILFVDDGSTDNTLRLARDFAKKHKQSLPSVGKNFTVMNEPHRGKGGTVIAGILKAQGDIILFTDTDQATPINEVEKIFPKFDTGFDIVIGSRTGRKGAPLVRKLMAYGFAFLRTLILRLPYKDTQCGFKAFKKESAGKIFRKMKVYNDKVVAGGAAVNAGFDLEVLYLARKMHLKVAEVAVNWRHQETERINPIKDSWEGMRDLFRVSINALMGKYK